MFINGQITCTFNLGCGHVTIFQGTDGSLKVVLVDDGLELKEFDCERPDKRDIKGKSPGIIS